MVISTYLCPDIAIRRSQNANSRVLMGSIGIDMFKLSIRYVSESSQIALMTHCSMSFNFIRTPSFHMSSFHTRPLRNMIT